MAKTTIATINKNIKVFNCKLRRGDGYFYFTSPDYNFTDSMVCVNRLEEISLRGWVMELVYKIQTQI